MDDCKRTMCHQKVTPVIVVHGGAQTFQPEQFKKLAGGTKAAARAGYKVLTAGGSALDAVTAAVTVLENDPTFDAGTGSVLTAKGKVEMDAVIMDGKTLNSGSVACVRNIKNPIILARRVMEKTKHCLLVGRGANKFAEEQGIEQVKPESLITAEARKEFEEFKEKGYGGAVDNLFSGGDSSGHDTTGAIAMDCQGNIAYGTSTGGITGKRPGRVGDSPIAGAGGYADNEVGAVSCTGHGESILKVVLAHQIISKMRQGMLPRHAGKDSLANMVSRVNGFGGVIILDKKGHVSTPFTTHHMAWAWAKDGVLHHGIKPKDNFIESIGNYEN